MRILGWDIDSFTLLVLVCVWVVFANLWAWWRRARRARQMTALARDLGLDYAAESDRISREAFAASQTLRPGFNAVLDVASAITYATTRARFTQTLNGRIDGLPVLVFDHETPRFRNLHPNRTTVVAWSLRSRRWPRFHVNPLGFNVDGLGVLQALRENPDLNVRVAEELANFAEDHAGVALESNEDWLLLSYAGGQMSADEVRRLLVDSREVLRRCSVEPGEG